MYQNNKTKTEKEIQEIEEMGVLEEVKKRTLNICEEWSDEMKRVLEDSVLYVSFILAGSGCMYVLCQWGLKVVLITMIIMML